MCLKVPQCRYAAWSSAGRCELALYGSWAIWKLMNPIFQKCLIALHWLCSQCFQLRSVLWPFGVAWAWAFPQNTRQTLPIVRLPGQRLAGSLVQPGDTAGTSVWNWALPVWTISLVRSERVTITWLRWSMDNFYSDWPKTKVSAAQELVGGYSRDTLVVANTCSSKLFR